MYYHNGTALIPAADSKEDDTRMCCLRLTITHKSKLYVTIFRCKYSVMVRIVLVVLQEFFFNIVIWN